MFLLFIKSWIIQESDISRIEFSTLTRGYHKVVAVTPSTVTITEQPKGEEKENVTEKKIDSAKWKQMMDTLKNISLIEIPALKSPTMKRTFDGARASTITIYTNKGETFSHAFDNENPNEKLHSLMLLMHDLENKDALK